MRLHWLLLLLLASCAAERAKDDEERPGRACESDRDCNRDDAGTTRSCGSRRLCVAGRCERDAGTQLLPCAARRGT